MNAQTMSTDAKQVSGKKLWFGFAASAAAWVLAGILNVLFAWQACLGGEAGSGVFTATWLRVLLGFITFGLLAVSIVAGTVSFRMWQQISNEHDFVHAEGRERREYLALCGVFISTSLGIGIALFAIPIYVLGICVRYR